MVLAFLKNPKSTLRVFLFNMYKLTLKIIIVIIINIFLTDIVSADNYIVSSSSNFKKIKIVDNINDQRVNKLEIFFIKHNSPLARYATNFVSEADNNNIDWRLVPAITGVESTFGKRIPKNSFNAYGWANGDFYFSSWEESIQIVSSTLNEKYYQKGAININKIARRYAPPSSNWAWKVKYFMNEIDPTPIEFDF